MSDTASDRAPASGTARNEPHPGVGSPSRPFPSSRLAGSASVVVVSTVLALSSLLALHFAQEQFGGYDLSPLIDLTWRLGRGEIPGTDFINTLPPLLLLALQPFGSGEPRWLDLTVANIAVTLVAYGLLVASYPRPFRSTGFAVAVALALCVPLVYTNHIWHSSLSQLASVIFVYAVYVIVAEDNVSRGRLGWLLLATALVATSKQNVALPTIVGTGAFLLFWRPSRSPLAPALTLAAGAVLGLLVASLALGLSFSDHLYLYRAVIGRAGMTSDLFTALKNVDSHRLLAVALAAIGLATLYSLSANPRSRPVRWLLGLMLMVALIPIATDWDSKFNNVTVPLFVCALLLFDPLSATAREGPQAPKPHPAPALHPLLLVSLFATVYALAVVGGYRRERMMNVGPFYEHPAGTTIARGYFRGLRTGPHFAGLLLELEQLQPMLQGRSVFFGPRIELGYLYTGSPSPRGLPLWWHPGTSYAAADQPRIVEAFGSHKPDVLVFARGDRTRMPSEILAIVERDFRPAGQHRYLDVYVRGRSGALSLPIPIAARPAPGS